MTPIDGRHGPLEATAAQNVLDAKGDQGRVLAIVIERIAAGDALDDEPGGFVQGVGNVRLSLTINSAVGLGQVPTQCISQKARRVQHDRLLDRPTGSTVYATFAVIARVLTKPDYGVPPAAASPQS